MFFRIVQANKPPTIHTSVWKGSLGAYRLIHGSSRRNRSSACRSAARCESCREIWRSIRGCSSGGAVAAHAKIANRLLKFHDLGGRKSHHFVDPAVKRLTAKDHFNKRVDGPDVDSPKHADQQGRDDDRRQRAAVSDGHASGSQEILHGLGGRRQGRSWIESCSLPAACSKLQVPDQGRSRLR